MTFDELVEEVYIVTGRRDLIEETKSAIKSATLKVHGTDLYSKDIHETGVEFTSVGYTQSLDYMSFIPNFKRLAYFRVVSGATDESGTFLDILSAQETIDSYGCNRTDIAYIAGRVLEIRSSVSFSYALLGAYVFPLVTEQNYSSWIAEYVPYAIVHEAAKKIFMAIGALEEVAGQASLAREEIIQLLPYTSDNVA